MSTPVWTTRAYDANGNLTLLDDSLPTEVSLAYNDLNQMTSRTDAQGTTSYIYDALGRRIAKTTGGTTTRYVHFGARVVMEKNLAAGFPTTAYAYDRHVDVVGWAYTFNAVGIPLRTVSPESDGMAGALPARGTHTWPDIHHLARKPCSHRNMQAEQHERSAHRRRHNYILWFLLFCDTKYIRIVLRFRMKHNILDKWCHQGAVRKEAGCAPAADHPWGPSSRSRNGES